MPASQAGSREEIGRICLTRARRQGFGGRDEWGRIAAGSFTEDHGPRLLIRARRTGSGSRAHRGPGRERRELLIASPRRPGEFPDPRDVERRRGDEPDRNRTCVAEDIAIEKPLRGMNAGMGAQDLLQVSGLTILGHQGARFDVPRQQTLQGPFRIRQRLLAH